MSRLNLNIERNLYQNGYQLIAGVDEVGRGSWAGPIVAGAVILPEKNLEKCRKAGIDDSKILTPKKREELFLFIAENCAAWAVEAASSKIIDKIGIAKANRLVMERAIKNLGLRPDYLLIDAVKLNNAGIDYDAIIGGDAQSISIAAASILAKVWRDRWMVKKDNKFPLYGFARHKGYGTAYHHQMLLKHGLCELHRQSFEPMKSMSE